MDLAKVRELNYDHHRRMTEMHLKAAETPHLNDVRAAVDDKSYRMLLRNVPKDQPLVLELGSASGGQWNLLKQWGKELVGIDLYEPLVMDARKRGLPVYLGFVEDMTIFPTGHFDMVCSRHVMEHLGDLDRGIEEVKRVLRVGGYSAHVTPDMPVDDEPAHLNKLKQWEWAERWGAHGFQVLSAERHPFNGGEVHVVAQRV